MSDYQVVAGLYVLASICVVYKLAYLVRQTATLPNLIVYSIRIVAVGAGTLIIWRVVEVTEGEVTAEPFDVMLQIAWCFVLYSIIMLLGRRKHVW